MHESDRHEFGLEERLACQRLIDMALVEDWGKAGDVTSQALVPPAVRGAARIVVRQPGMLAGLDAARMLLLTVAERCARCGAQMVLRHGKHGDFLGCFNYPNCRYTKGLDDDPAVTWQSDCCDGMRLEPGQVIARVQGLLRLLLKCERVTLNFLQHLSGVATLTRRYVDAVAGLPCQIYDTRKTTPGWRVLEKYAVRVGGGYNHRMGLHDAVLIKDNHLVAWRRQSPERSLADAVRAARAAVGAGTVVEIEVDSIADLDLVLAGEPDIVLLDNMSPEQLREAVGIRNQRQPRVILEASGGVTLETIRVLAETGVDRVSVGALTHSAPALDIALDFEESSA